MDNEIEPSLPLDIPEQSEVNTGQKIGNARVSSKDQNLDQQLTALKKEKSSASLPTSPAARLRTGQG